MAVVQIQKKQPEHTNRFALFNLGFRPFFLGAAIFAIISIMAWLLIYTTHGGSSITTISPSQWHAHEMLYGYGMAVVSGFLLTAVKNWTGVQTLHGRALLGLFALWCLARLLFLFGSRFLPWVAVTDLLFGLGLLMAIAVPIIRSRQWAQLAVVSKVLLLWVGNIVFYLGCFNSLDGGMLYAINGILFIFISLILMIGRRVIPFFIERGIAQSGGAKVQLKQYQWLDRSILGLFLLLFINEIFLQFAAASVILSIFISILNGFRLCNWHVAALWRVPLLWSLYISSWLINFGFLLYGLQTFFSIPTILTLHLFTIGGIGLMTLAMMARVALGHSGRDIKHPSPWIKLSFAAVIVSALFRVLMPLLDMGRYADWILISGICWIVAFVLFLLVYAPILCLPRVDGTYG